MNPPPGNAEPQLGNHTWHTRGYLPHFNSREKIQSITFRLADALPQSKLNALEEELLTIPNTQRESERRKRIEEWLDSGIGCCALKHPKCATVIQDTLKKFNGERYKLLAWCIMPNHIHALIEPSESLCRIVQSWKSYTGRWAKQHNAELGLGVPRDGAFWMREYWDRFIRNEDHLRKTIEYIHNNPVKANLCQTPEQWPFSSAFKPGNAEPQLGNSSL